MAPMNLHSLKLSAQEGGAFGIIRRFMESLYDFVQLVFVCVTIGVRNVNAFANIFFSSLDVDAYIKERGIVRGREHAALDVYELEMVSWRRDFHTTSGNEVVNSINFFRFVDEELYAVKLHGRCYIRRYGRDSKLLFSREYCFPASKTVSDQSAFFRYMMFQADDEDRRLLFVRGILTRNLYLDTKWYWHDIDVRSSSRADLVSYYVPNYTFHDRCSFGPFDQCVFYDSPEMWRYGLAGLAFFTPVLEELFKYSMGCLFIWLICAGSVVSGRRYDLELIKRYGHIVAYALFGIYEFCEYLSTRNVRVHQRLPALAMHFVTGFVPYRYGLILHVTFNAIVFCLEFRQGCGSLLNLSSQNLDDAGELSWLVDLILKIHERNYVGIGLSMGMKLSNLSRFMDNFGLKDISDIVKMLNPESSEENQTVLLANEPSKFATWVNAVLPEYVSKSPSTRKILAFVFFLVGCDLVQDASMWKMWADKIDWPVFEGVATFLVVAQGALQSVLSMFVRLGTAKSWRDVFDLPSDAKFIAGANELLYVIVDKDDAAGVMHKIDLANELISSRVYKTNDSNINKLLDKLRQYVIDKTRYVASNFPRPEPLVIWLNGDPGVGKTILIDSIINTFAIRRGYARFEGDVIKVDMKDKYPCSSGLNPNAKYLVVNDLEADFSEYPKQDLMDLSVFCQKVIDTYPLYFRGAAIEEKGVVLSDVEVLIVTSNHVSYKCAGETEKLQRRLEDQLVVDVRMKDKDGRSIDYKKLKGLSQGDRNDSIYFSRVDVECKNKFVKFTPRVSPVYHYAGFFHELWRMIDDHFARCELEKFKFKDPTQICACGIPKVLHYESGGWKALSHVCVGLELPVPKPVVAPDPNVIDLRETESDTSLLSAPAFTVNFWFGFLCCFSIWWFFVIKWQDIIDWITEQYADRVTLKLLESPWFDRYLALRARYDRMTPHVIEVAKVHKFFLRLKRFCRTYSKQIAVILGGAVGAALYQMTKKSKSSLLGTAIYEHQVDPASIQTVVEQREMAFSPDVRRQWGKSDGDINTIKILTLGVGHADLVRKIQANLFSGKLWVGNDSKPVIVLVLSPDFICFNRHFVYKMANETWTHEYHDRFDLQIGDVRVAYEFKDLFLPKGSEVGFLKNHFKPHCAPLHKFLVESVSGAMDVTVISPDSCYSVPAFKAPFYDPLGGVDSDSTYAWSAEARPGVCGSVAIGFAKGGCFILGIVSYGSDRLNRVGCAPMLRKMYDEVCSNCPYPMIDTHLLDFPFTTGQLSPNSEFRNIRSDNLLSLGTLPGSTSSFHSKIVPSPVYDDFFKNLSKPYAPPHKLRGLTDQGVWASNVTQTFAGINNNNLSLDSLRTRAMVSYLNDVLPVSNLVTKKIQLSPLTLGQAIFGREAVGISRVEFNTSVGKTLRDELHAKNKYDLFDEVDGVYYFNPFAKRKVDELIDSLDKHIVPAVVVEFAPKDEVRPVEKLNVFKTRLFSVADFSYNIVMRMFLMPLITYMLSTPLTSECYGTINAGSKQWNDLGNHIFICSDGSKAKCIDMDFKSFDASHDIKFIQTVATFFYMLAIRCGYEQGEADKVYLLVSALKVQQLFYLLDVILKTKGLPSGVIITLILNSIVNSTLMRMAWIELVTHISVSEFQRYVHAATTGDDNACGVDSRVIDLYNFLTIKVKYNEWGYDVTPANKSSSDTATVPFDELVYLKRRFVKWDDGFYRAPLEKDSIWKSLCFERLDQGTTSKQRLLDTARGCQREAYLHGRDFFDDVQKQLIASFRRIRLDGALTLLSFDEIDLEFHNGTFRTFAC
jgi:hypothetical protein